MQPRESGTALEDAKPEITGVIARGSSPACRSTRPAGMLGSDSSSHGKWQVSVAFPEALTVSCQWVVVPHWLLPQG